MPFQFHCPQGHLLEGHESQSGQQGQCPVCGVTFIFPAVTPAAPAAQPAIGGGMSFGQPQFGGPQFGGPQFGTPQFGGPAFGDPAAGQQPTPGFVAPEEPAPAVEPEQPQGPRIVHIPCPNGHVLETPDDMIGQAALCPYCNTQFELLYEKSHEFEVERAEKAKKREKEINDLWVKWSIRAAIFVGIMLVGMIAWTMFGG